MGLIRELRRLASSTLPASQNQAPRELTFWERRAIQSAGPGARGFWNGLRAGAEGSIALGLPVIALEVGMAQRGEAVPTLLARGAGLVTYPAFTGIIGAALGTAFPALPAAGFLASVLAFYPDSLVQGGLLRSIRTVTDANRRTRRFEAGGDYQDSLLAQRQRLSAVTDMSGALANSRRYLGQEARLLHQ